MSRRSPGRLFNRSLAAMAVVGLVAGACSSSASPSPSAAASQPAASAATESAAPAASHEAVAITVGVLRPGATQEAVDALNLQIT